MDLFAINRTSTRHQRKSNSINSITNYVHVHGFFGAHPWQVKKSIYFPSHKKTTNTQTKSAPSAHVLSYYNFWWGRALPKRLKTNQRHLFSGRVESNKTDSFFRAHFGNIIRICKGTAEPKMSHVSVISVFYEQTNERKKKESRLPFEYKCWCECCIGIYFGLRRLTVLEALRRNMYFLSSNEAVAAKPKEIRSEKIEISKIIFRLPAQMVLRIYRNAL